MEKCLYCYKPLKDGQTDFHPHLRTKDVRRKEGADVAV